MKPTCDCRYFDHQVCNICQDVDPAKPSTDRTVRTVVDNLTREEVKTAVCELVRMKAGPGEAAIDFAHRCQMAIDMVEGKGWRLGLSLSVHAQVKTSRGHWFLKQPRNIFNVVYSFYDRGNIATKVIFHISECRTKREAMARIEQCPAPCRR